MTNVGWIVKYGRRQKYRGFTYWGAYVIVERDEDDKWRINLYDDEVRILGADEIEWLGDIVFAKECSTDESPTEVGKVGGSEKSRC